MASTQTTSHTHHRRNSSLTRRMNNTMHNQQSKFTASLPRLPPSPLLPSYNNTPVPSRPGSPKMEEISSPSWATSPPPAPMTMTPTTRKSQGSPRSSTSSIRLDDYKFRSSVPASSGFLPAMPRQMQRHGRWLILACLLATCVFVIFCTPGRHVLRVSPLHYAESHRSGVPIPGSVSNKPIGHRGGSWRRPGANSPALTLSSAEELAVVTAYLAALPENRIPTVVDPKTKLDPQLVLDFDTRSPSAREEVAEVVHDAWHRNPVVIYGKTYSQDSREVEAMIDKLNLAPAATVFHVNDRPDGEILEPLIFRLTNATTLPLVLIGGTPLGGLTELKNLSADGTLPKLIEIAGAKIDGKKKKGGRKH